MKQFTQNDEAVYLAVQRMKLATKEEVMEYTGFAVKKAEKHLLRVKKAELVFEKKDRASTSLALYSTDKKYFARISPLTIEHELMISKCQARLHQTKTLTIWQQGREIENKLVRPDAFFTLSFGKSMSFYLEADNYHEGRSDNRAQMLKKYEGYVKLFEETVRDGQPPFRVITVTTSKVRARNLSKLAEQAVASRMRSGYLFTTLEDFFSPLSEIYYTPYEDKPYSLLPQMVK